MTIDKHRPPDGAIAGVRSHVRATKQLTDDMRETDALLESIGSRFGLDPVLAAHDAALDRCIADMERHPADDPMHAAARVQLRLLTGWPYRLWLEFRMWLNRALRLVGRELLYALIVPLTLLLIVVFNVVALLLLWWLLFSF